MTNRGKVKKESVGQLVANCEAIVVDEEIYVKGSSVMMGYYNDEELTKLKDSANILKDIAKDYI